jgi:hypothetical protein
LILLKEFIFFYLGDKYKETTVNRYPLTDNCICV